MKPINLKISAFGPYKDIEVVDFKDLNEAKLYLITGDTGSGKTTIFDAITFALYGSASGKNRENNSFRSHFATPTTKTYVEFTFMSNGTKYEVERNPEYPRPTKNGNKMTTEKAEATLSFNDEVITGVKNVTLRIETILGITKDQFCQIAMIAQGDFLELLLADTKERMKIFRSIFNTNNFNIFQEKIKLMEGEARRSYEKERDSVLQYLDSFKTSDEILILIDDLKKNSNITSIDNIIHQIEMQIENRKSEMSSLIAQDEQIKRSIDNINTTIGRMELIKVNRKKVQDAQQFIENNSGLLEELRMQFEVLDDQKESIDEKKIEHAKQVEKFMQQKGLEKTIEELKSNIQKVTLEVETKNQLKLNLEQRNTIINAEIEELKDIEQIQELKLKKIELANQLNIYSEAKKEVNKLETLLGDLEREKHNYLDIKLTYDDAKNKLEMQEKVFYENQAAFLAIDLKPGTPCPVCGSIEHPNLAKTNAQTVTKEEIQNSKSLVEKAQRKLDKTFQDTQLLKVTAENIESKLIKTNGDNFVANINFEYNNIYQQISINEQNIAQIEKDIRYVEKISHEKAQNIIEIENMQLKIYALDKQIVGDQSTLEEKNKQYAEIAMIDELYLSSLKNEIDIYNIKYLKVKGDMENLATAINKEQITIQNLSGQENNEELVDINDLKEKLMEEQNTKKAIESNIQDISFENQVNQSTLEKIDINLIKIKAIESKHIILKAMSDTANGTVAQKEKIMLETYVQMAYFDQVIEYANTRFMVMSDGQFELKRRVDSTSRQSQSGLELDVIDHYNGTSRSVKSLSGGESFMASLALALGLSDEIQYSSGGINIESMFVDEGFGTLSEDALNNSIKILTSLTDGNKSIGIISHVSELKQKIDTQLYITKDKANGSKIEIRR